MAKTTSWAGGISGDWGVAANWTNGVPAAGDTVIFPSTATRDVTAGLAQGAIDLLLLRVVNGCPVNIGLPGSPLVIAAEKVVHRGSGTFYFQTSQNLLGDEVIVNSPNLTGAMYLSAIDAARKLFRVLCVRGRLVIEASLDELSTLMTSYNEQYGFQKADVDCRMTNAAGIGGIHHVAGRMKTYVDSASSNHQYGGYWETGAGLHRSLTLSGGIYRYTVPSSVGAMASLSLIGGTFDAQGNHVEQQVSSVYEWPGGQFLYDDDLMTVNTWKDMTGGED